MAATTTNVRTLSTSASSHTFIPSTPPISLLPTPLARRYTHLHVLILFGFYLLRFKALVVDPVTTMLNDLPYVALFQLTFCLLCLPPAGTTVSSITSEKGSGGNAKTSGGSLRRKPPVVGSGGKGARDPGTGTSLSNKIAPSILSLILSTVLPPLPMTVLTILMGAPATTHIPHTLLLATHLSILTTLPLFYTHGVSSTAWYEIMCLYLPFDGAGAWGGSIGTIIGAWLGAVPIPLDWDREWQKWPVTVLLGAVGGWAIGKETLGVLFWRGRRWEMEELDEKEWEYIEDESIEKKSQ